MPLGNLNDPPPDSVNALFTESRKLRKNVEILVF